MLHGNIHIYTYSTYMYACTRARVHTHREKIYTHAVSGKKEWVGSATNDHRVIILTEKFKS